LRGEHTDPLFARVCRRRDLVVEIAMENAIKRMTIVSVIGNINIINDAWTTREIRKNM